MQNEERINGLETQVRTLKRIVYGFGCLIIFGLQISAQLESTVKTNFTMPEANTGQYVPTAESLSATQLVLPLLAIAILLFVINRPKTDADKSIEWHYKLNNWIVKNLSLINAFTFISIVVFSSYIGGNVIDNQWVGILLGFIVGLIFGCLNCGILSIILTSSKNLRHIANSLSKIEKSKNK